MVYLWKTIMTTPLVGNNSLGICMSNMTPASMQKLNARFQGQRAQGEVLHCDVRNH